MCVILCLNLCFLPQTIDFITATSIDGTTVKLNFFAFLLKKLTFYSLDAASSKSVEDLA